MTREYKKTILAVLAHPDDESFGMGGTLALYAHNGVDVHLVCATRGEAGDVPAESLDGFTSISELREHELRCAAKHLGIAGVHFLGYRDSGMAGSPENHHPDSLAAANEEKVVADVVHYLRWIKPQVVITFDPIGGYLHPDHIAIQRATVKAFHYAGDVNYHPDGLDAFQPQKLYFHTFPHGFMRLAVLWMRITGKNPRKFGRNGDIDLEAIAGARFPVHARIDYRLFIREKELASACHASQGGARITQGFFGWIRSLFGVSDQYMRAYPPPGRKIERDLFDSVKM